VAFGRDPARAIGSQTAGGNETVQMRMVTPTATIPWVRKRPKSRCSIHFILCTVPPYRSNADRNGAMAPLR